MTGLVLAGRRILVVEDDYLLAVEVRDRLLDAGADVVGPAPAVADAQALVREGGALDAAVLDVNLRGEMVFPVADALDARHVPFVFLTGYDQWSLPARYALHPRLEKPCQVMQLEALLRSLLAEVA